MVTLRRVDTFSAGRFGFFFGVATAFISILFSIFRLVVFEGVPISVFPLEFWFFIARELLIYGFVTALGFGFFAFLYNMGFGNLKLEFDMPTTPPSKRKNDEFEQIDIE